MNERTRKVKKARQPLPRYGIAEWYGKDIIAMTPEERQRLGCLAVAQHDGRALIESPACPFLASLIPSARCHKKGGVCSIRKYGSGLDPVDGENVATTCPSRFLQPDRMNKSLFSWISEKMLDIPGPIIIKETPFLRKIARTMRLDEVAGESDAEADEQDKNAGRIDWILVKPTTIDAEDPEWCAVETQSLYFSGQTMRLEFDAYAEAPSKVIFPVGKRRPDYRSNGPKRLLPQLEVKIPVLRSWGKKVAVVVDRFFYNNMSTLVNPFPKARNDREKRHSADVAWFIVDYDNGMCLKIEEVIFTSLESSRNALNATEPLSKDDFTEKLKNVMRTSNRTQKVFRVSGEATPE